MKFIKCVQFIEALEQEPSRTAMTKILAQLLEECSPVDAQMIAYLSMGSLFPAYKDQQFNIAQKGIISIIASLIGWSEEETQAYIKKTGDAGVVVREKWQGGDQGLTLHQVYESLVKIAEIAGTGSTEKKLKALVDLLQQLDNLGAKFVVRIVTKTMRLGFSDMTFLDGLSWMLAGNKSYSKKLEHAFNICADLGLVALTLKQDGVQGIENMTIQVGIPIRPAAAERLTSPKAVVEKLGDCVAQPKLDGFRVQVHLKHTNSKTEVAFFSRNMLDMSDMFPDLKKIVTELPVKSLICEGEAIVYDADTDTFLPFQETVKRKRKHDIDQVSEDLPLRLYLFDLLYLDGQSMLEHSHKERRAALLEVCRKVDNDALQVIEEKHIHTAHQLEEYFLNSIGAGLEGLVVKREDAQYQPGKRNFNWIKLKREAHGSLVDTVDGVILGYYVGRGKRAKFGIGAFLLGVYDHHLDRFTTTAKVGTGLTDAEFKELKKRCDSLAVDHQPKNVVCTKGLAPDVWIQPEIVCVIKSDEITLSPVHSAGKTDSHPGYALRFPRFVEYRVDKSAKDATTVDELKRLYQEQKS